MEQQQPRKSGLLQLLRESAGSQFVIPVFQRNYTWTAKKEVKQYLDDLMSVLSGDYRNHFLGIIIYLEKPIDFSSRELSIIDGQQRLTTTFLLLYAIRGFMKENHDDNEVKSLNDQFLTNTTDSIKYKLKPLVADDDAYKCIADDRIKEIKDTNSNVYKNYLYMKDYLNDIFIKGYNANDVLMALDKLYVVCVPISEDDDAQKIFESINATGAKLTAADLIRNYLLMNLDSNLQDKYYEKYWIKLEENVSTDSKKLELFFRTYLAIKKYEWIPKKDVYNVFVNWTREKGMPIKELFEELVEYSYVFYELLNDDLSNIDEDFRAAIQDFRRIQSDVQTPVMMEFYELFRKGLISSITLNELFWSVNTYMIRRNLCVLDTHFIAKLFPTVLKKVLNQCDGNYDDIVKILNQVMVGDSANTSGSYMPTDKQMKEFLYNANVYNRPALRIVLDRLELHQNPAPVDLSSLSVEHLMPQTPTEEWLEELDTDMETYMENLHRLGNLTLASKSDNSKMSNLNWEYKNEVLKDTAHLTLNMDLIPIEKWDLKKIDERTEDLIEKICEIYPYPDVDISKDNDEDLVPETDALKLCVENVIPKDNIDCIRKWRVYKAKDNSVGYVLVVSKMSPQGESEKYWFGYREKRFQEIMECQEKYMLFVCRSSIVTILQFPKEFFDDKLDNFNVSTDAEGNITHYHIVFYQYQDGRITLLLSKPTLREMDVTNYIVAEL